MMMCSPHLYASFSVLYPSVLLILLLQQRSALAKSALTPQSSCMDGAPAVFPCNATRVAGRKLFVCALDLTLGCEKVFGHFFCCAHPASESTTTKTMTKATRTQTAPTATSTAAMMDPTMQMLVNQMVLEELQQNQNASDSSVEMLLDAIVSSSSSNITTNSSGIAHHGPEVSGESASSVNSANNMDADMLETTDHNHGMVSVLRHFSVVDASVEQQQLQKDDVDQQEMVKRSKSSSTSQPQPMPMPMMMNQTMVMDDGTASSEEIASSSSNGTNTQTTMMPMQMLATTPRTSSSSAAEKTNQRGMEKMKNGNHSSNNARRPVCIDIGPQCLLTAKLCKNPQYSRLVRLQCPRTCNLCAPDGNRLEEANRKCLDRGKDCAKAKFLCKNPAFSALMAAECAKTCGHCQESVEESKESEESEGNEASKKPQTGGVGRENKQPMKVSAGMMMTSTKQPDSTAKKEKCMDNYPRCFVWRLQGFCTSHSYSPFLKRRYCAQTCGLCTATGTMKKEE